MHSIMKTSAFLHSLRPAVLPAFLCLVSTVQANPSGGVASHGSISINGAGRNLTINQLTDKAIINWEDFSIKKGEVTRFLQPNSRSAVLNRVVTGNPSALDGLLQANGKVLLINPNGIVVGKSGTIDVGGLVLSTLDVSDDEFLAGGDMLFKGDSAAGVENYGRINAIDGDVFLIGHHVVNAGAITAPNGTVGLGAGSEVLLTATPNADGERVFVRAGGKRGGVGIENSGSIEAAAVELKAHGNMFALAINNSGTVRATGVSRQGGQVYLRSPGGKVSNTGTIAATLPGGNGGRILIEAGDLELGGTLDVRPLRAGGRPGDISLLAKNVTLLPDAQLGGTKIRSLTTQLRDINNVFDAIKILREVASNGLGGGPIGVKGGRIERAGRLADGPPAIENLGSGHVGMALKNDTLVSQDQQMAAVPETTGDAIISDLKKNVGEVPNPPMNTDVTKPGDPGSPAGMPNKAPDKTATEGMGPNGVKITPQP